MKKIEASLSEFLGTVHYDFKGLLAKIDQMRANISRLVEDRKRTESSIFEEQIRLNIKRAVKNSITASAVNN